MFYGSDHLDLVNQLQDAQEYNVSQSKESPLNITPTGIILGLVTVVPIQNIRRKIIAHRK